MFKEKVAKLLKINSEFISSSEKSNFSIEDIEKLGVHPAFIKYLWAERFLKIEDKNRNDLFLFSRDEIITGLKKAAVFNLNFLFNPVFLLKKILFANALPVSGKEIEDLKNRVYYFRYYIDIIEKLFSSGKLLPESYDETMIRIHKRLLDNNFKSVISDGLDALNHFFNYGDEYAGLDRECIKLFLLSRDLKDEFEKVNPYFSGKDDLKVWKIKDILTSGGTSVFDTGLKRPKPVDSPATVVPEKIEEPKQIHEPPKVISKIAPDFVPPIVKKIIDPPPKPMPERLSSLSLDEFITLPKKRVVFEEVEVEPKPVEMSSEAEEIISKLPSINDPEPIKIFDDEPIQRYEFSFPPKVELEPIKVVEKKSLLSLLSQDESLKLIQQIFDGDNSDFFNSIEALEKCSNIIEAKNLLSIIFSNAGLSQNNKYAKLLTEKTERSFTG